MEARISTLEAAVTNLLNVVMEQGKAIEELKKAGKRDRGPDSTREMTQADAERIMLGDLKEMSHKKAAEELGLSYGQVYSARGGYTFKGVYKKAEELKKSQA